VVSFSLVGN